MIGLVASARVIPARAALVGQRGPDALEGDHAAEPATVVDDGHRRVRRHDDLHRRAQGAGRRHLGRRQRARQLVERAVLAVGQRRPRHPAEEHAVGGEAEPLRAVGGHRRPGLVGRRPGLHDRPWLERQVGDGGQREAADAAVAADEPLHELVGGRPEQLVGRGVLLEHPAHVHEGDAVGQLDRLVEVVGDQDDRLVDAGLQGEQLVLQPARGRPGPPRRRARPSAARAGRRPGPGPRRPAAAGRRTARPGSGRAGSRRARPGRPARRCGPWCGPCPSPGRWGRRRCSWRRSGGGRGRPAGSRSRCPAAASPPACR